MEYVLGILLVVLAAVLVACVLMQSGKGKKLFRCGIALRVDGGVIQYLLTFRHTQEARALLEGLGTKLGHL